MECKALSKMTTVHSGWRTVGQDSGAMRLLWVGNFSLSLKAIAERQRQLVGFRMAFWLCSYRWLFSWSNDNRGFWRGHGHLREIWRELVLAPRADHCRGHLDIQLSRLPMPFSGLHGICDNTDDQTTAHFTPFSHPGCNGLISENFLDLLFFCLPRTVLQRVHC
jgi:hypothetical protein